MSENTDKATNDKVIQSEMEDGGRRLLDVINDSQLLQSFLDSSNVANFKNDSTFTSKIIANNVKDSSTKSEIKAKKSVVVATKSSPSVSNVHCKKISKNDNKVNTLQSGLIMDKTQAININPSPVGMIPLSLAQLSTGVHSNSQSVSLAQPLTTTLTGTGNQIRAPGQTIYPHTQIQLAPRPMTVLPQQLIMPGMQMTPSNNIPQFVFASRPSTPASAIQQGPLIQIIQTSQGTQIVPTNPSSIQQIVTSSPSTVKVTNSNRLNKQILPKPLGSLASVSSSQPTANTSKTTTSQANIKLISSIQQPTASFGTPLNTSANLNTTPQILLGSGGQHAGIIAGPHGTYVLNNIIPGLGSQPLLFPGNVQNSPVQIAIRPQAPLFVNNNLSTDSSNISFAFSSNPQVSTSKPQPTQPPQTFVLSNQNPSVSNANGLIMAPNVRDNGQNIFFRQNLFGAPQVQSNQPQFLQVQTPNGPVLVAVNSNPQIQAQTIINPQSSSNVQPSTIRIGNTLFSLAANPPVNLPTAQNIQTILTQTPESSSISNSNILQPNIPKSSSLIMNSSQVTHSKSQPVASQNIVVEQKAPKANKGLNLADLLKETGILPDFSPPSSPKNSTTLPLAESNSIVNANCVQNENKSVSQSQNLLPPQSAPTTQQFRISVTPDGTIVLLSPNSNSLITNQFQPNAQLNSHKDTSGIGSSQPSPDSTTPSIDASTSSPLVQQPISLANINEDDKDCKQLKADIASSLTLNSNFEISESTNTNLCLKTTLNESEFHRSENKVLPTLTSCSTTPSTIQTSVLPSSRPLITQESCLNFNSQQVNTITTIAPILTSQIVSQSSSLKTVSNCSVDSEKKLLQTSNQFILLFNHEGSLVDKLYQNNTDFPITLEAQLNHLLSIKDLMEQQKEWLDELMNLKKKFMLLGAETTSPQLTISPLTEQLLKLSKLNAQKKPQPVVNNTADNVSDNVLLNNNLIKLKTFTISPSPAVNNAITKDESCTTNESNNPELTSMINELNKTLDENTAAEQKKKLETEKKKYDVFKTIQQQLNADQNSALNPDCKTPFKSRDDACKRLLRYHVFDSPVCSQNEIDKFDELYESIAQILLSKKDQLYKKYQYLLLRQGMRDSLSCEHVMLGKMFLEEETNLLKAEREQLFSDKSSEVSTFIEDDCLIETKLESSCLKRKFTDNECDNSQYNQFNNYFPVKEIKSETPDYSSQNIFGDDKSFLNHSTDDPNKDNILSSLLPELGNNRDIINSVEDLIDQLNSPTNSHQNLHPDHQSFIDSLDNVPLNNDSFTDPNDPNSLKSVSDDLEALCSKIKSEEQMKHSLLNLPWDSTINCSSSSIETQNFQSNTNMDSAPLSWNTRFGVTEAEAAVQSIMKNEEEPMSVDLSGIDELNLPDNDHFLNHTNEQNDICDPKYLLSDSISQQELDVQMHCAIKSIMMPADIVPTMSTSNQTNYHNMSNSTYNSYSSHQMSNHLSGQMRPNNMMTYSSSVANDQLLDEAVKSILS